MSDTPRTDAAWKWSQGGMLMGNHARRLERELNAANKRIAELEESLDTLTLVVGLTPVRKSKEAEALQEAISLARETLTKEWGKQ